MSSDLAISVTDLSKSYSIAEERDVTRTLAESISGRLRRPFKRQQRDIFWALRDVSFEVRPGEALGIIGRNGAGKSTALKVLSRITEPTHGEIRMYGRVGSLLEVGTGFHPELTGRENIYLNGAVLGMTRRDVGQVFDEIVEFSGLQKFLDVPVKRYSSGMQVRLAFAVAAHLEPEILLLDEVLAVGDAEFQKKCLGKMGQVAKQDARTVLFVSHNMAAIQSLCTRCIYLESGRIVFDGKPADAISRYLAATQPVEATGQPGEFLANVGQGGAESGVIQKVSLSTDDGPASAVAMGGHVSVSVELAGYCNVAAGEIGVSVHTDLDQRLATVGTWMRPPMTTGERQFTELVTFRLGPISFTPGRYWLTIWVWDGVNNTTLEEIERIAYFDVEQADVFGSGHPFSSAEGLMFVDFDWCLDESERLRRDPVSGSAPLK